MSYSCFLPERFGVAAERFYFDMIRAGRRVLGFFGAFVENKDKYRLDQLFDCFTLIGAWSVALLVGESCFRVTLEDIEREVANYGPVFEDFLHKSAFWFDYVVWGAVVAVLRQIWEAEHFVVAPITAQNKREKDLLGTWERLIASLPLPSCYFGADEDLREAVICVACRYYSEPEAVRQILRVDQYVWSVLGLAQPELRWYAAFCTSALQYVDREEFFSFLGSRRLQIADIVEQYLRRLIFIWALATKMGRDVDYYIAEI